MMIINCQRCGLEVEAQRSTKKFCSAECRVKYHNDARSPRPEHKLTCNQCGGTFWAKKGDTEYCPPCRTSETRRIKREYQRRRIVKGYGIVDSCRDRGAPFAYAVPDYWNKRIIEEQGGVCAVTGCNETELDCDHKTSVNRLKEQGVYETRINNIQFLCKFHNASKRAKCTDLHPEWLRNKLDYLDACFTQMEAC